MASITRFYALVLSTVLLLSGVPGFFPNIVSFQPLITFFALTLVHAVVHAAVGLLGLLITALASDDSVRVYTVGIALLYGILAAVGVAGVNFAPVLYFNSADNVLHGAIFALSLGVALAGVAEERSRRRQGALYRGSARFPLGCAVRARANHWRPGVASGDDGVNGRRDGRWRPDALAKPVLAKPARTRTAATERLDAESLAAVSTAAESAVRPAVRSTPRSVDTRTAPTSGSTSHRRSITGTISTCAESVVTGATATEPAAARAVITKPLAARFAAA